MADKKYLDYEGLELYNDLIKETYAPVQAIQYKGTVATISGLPTVSGVAIGSMYNITEGGISTSDFVEGAGKVIRNGTNVVAINVAADGDPVEMKWDIIAGVFSVDDKLTFGTSMPVSPENGDTFLYMGNNVYEYNAVTPTGTENPKELNWYEYDATESEYNLTEDEEVQSGTSYFVKNEKYVKGVIYVYSEASTEWVSQTSGDIFQPISEAEIRALFV